MKTYRGIREGRTRLSGAGMAAVIAGAIVAVSAGWTGAWAQCDYDSVWANKIPFASVITDVDSLNLSYSTNDKERCIFIKGLNSGGEINLGTDGAKIFGYGGDSHFFNQDDLKGLTKKDSGYYIYIPKQAYFTMKRATIGTPVCKTPVTYTITFNINYNGGTNPTAATTKTDGTLASLPAPTRTGYNLTGWYTTATTGGTAVTTSTKFTANDTIYARWTIKTYTLTASAAPTVGGTVTRSPSTSPYDSGTVVTVTATAAAGYTFTGWSGASAATTSSVTITMDANKTLTANFQQNAVTPTTKFTLTTSANPAAGGTITRSPNATTYDSGTTVTVTAAATSGYTFTGWSGASTVTSASVQIAMNEDRTLTANFQSNSNPSTAFTITFDPADGTVSPTSAKTGTNGRLDTLPIPTRSGYTFDGWFATSSGDVQVTKNTQFTADATIYAQWTKISATIFTITFNANGGAVTPSYGTTGTDSTLASLPTPKSDGYQFDGWFTTAAEGGTAVTAKSTKFSANDTIYAHWSVIPPDAFTITFDPRGGTVSKPTATTGEDGTLGSLPTATLSGYHFDGWFTAASGGTEVTTGTKFTADATVYAQWTAAPTIFTITFNANYPGGTVSPPTATTGPDSTLAGLPVPTRDGYSCDGWFTAASDGTEVTMSTKFSASVTIYAQWTLASKNIAEIDNVFFTDSSANFRFTVVYHLTEAKDDHTIKYIVTLDSAGTNIFLPSRASPINVSSAGAKDTLKILINEPFEPLFDTTYWVHIYTVDKNEHPGEEKSVKSVKSGPFTHQTVLVAPGGSKSADNYNFKLDAVRWAAGLPSVEIKVESSNTPSENIIESAGFITVGGYGYTYNFVKDSDKQLPLVALNIGIRADIPEGYSSDKVKLYRWNGNYWEVVFDTKYEGGYFTGTAIDSVSKDANTTYRLMINTAKHPTVSNFRDPTGEDVVDMSGQISKANFTVTGNVGNFRVRVLTGPAKDSTALDTARIISNTDKGTSRNVEFSIGQEIVENSVNFGILAFIIVNSGNGDTAINVSYRVKSNRYGGFSVSDALKNKKKWFPFAAQVELTGDSVKTALEQALYKGEDKIGVHDTLYRLFRYNKTEADRVGNPNGWIEYDPGTNDGLFAMKPARLMWFKTSVAGAIFNFGAATSISLRNVFEITLPPNQWTDIAMPFRFDVCLGDIKDAMADEWSNLEFYRWEGGDPKFVAKVLNSPTAPYDSVVLKGNVEPFTVFNKSTRSVTLRIPPTPAFLSKHYKASNDGRAKALAKTTAGAQYGSDGTWYYTLHTEANGSEVSDLFVGYRATEWAFAVPPSFGNESVVLVGDDGAETGHHFGPSIASGRTYKLRFYNDGGQRAAFKFSAKPSADIPISARVTFVRASTGEILGGSGGGSEHSITVAGMSHEDVFMIVGNSGYRARAASVNAGAKFTVGRINVNMSARSARISYYIPESGINRVEVSIYDIKGRQVWRTSQAAKAAAWNTVEWNSRGSRHGATSNGLYIVRIKAMNAGGTAGVVTKRIMFSR